MDSSHQCLRQRQPSVQVGHRPTRDEDHDPLHHCREEEEGEGDPEH